ncbi:MAG TPA: dethiobiotin synthase [Gammaproteobacteria bacterium]|nr:dethiobiotin synthase [Gammaproteobacteria bacterium]
MHGFFVSGTDTGVGKTLVSLGLMQALKSRGHVVVGMKPVASGARPGPQGMVNDDALRLQRAASFHVRYDRVNPCLLQGAVAPHLAAAQEGVSIEIPALLQACGELAAEADRVVVEGVGGWLVPLDDRHTLEDLARAFALPVILVVAIRLGCLNHALLTERALAASGLPFAGWVANRLDRDVELADENVEALRRRLGAPLLADIPYGSEADVVADASRQFASRLSFS